MTGVTVVIPTIPPRAELLARAVNSVSRQTRPPEAIAVAYDNYGRGAPYTRSQGLNRVDTEWAAFLDDDDVMGEHHLERLLQTAKETGADLVYPWYTVIGGTDPFPHLFGRPWDPADPQQTTITTLVRTELAQRVGGFADPGEDWDPAGNRAGEDFKFVCRISDAGGKVVHLAERTWFWHHHRGNTSGRNWHQQSVVA